MLNSSESIDFKGFGWCPEVESNHRHKDFQFYLTLSLAAIKSIAIGKIKVKKNHNAFDWFLFEARYAAQTARNNITIKIIPNKGNDPIKSCDGMLGPIYSVCQRLCALESVLNKLCVKVCYNWNFEGTV